MENSSNYINQLADYIKKNLAKGYTLDSLKFSLYNQGYSRTSVEKAVELVHLQLAMIAPKMIEKPAITYKIYEDERIEEPKSGFFSSFFKKIFG